MRICSVCMVEIWGHRLQLNGMKKKKIQSVESWFIVLILFDTYEKKKKHRTLWWRSNKFRWQFQWDWGQRKNSKGIFHCLRYTFEANLYLIQFINENNHRRMHAVTLQLNLIKNQFTIVFCDLLARNGIEQWLNIFRIRKVWSSVVTAIMPSKWCHQIVIYAQNMANGHDWTAITHIFPNK